MKLERIVICASVALVAVVASADEYLDPKGLGFDPFVPFDALPKDELYPQNAACSEEGRVDPSLKGADRIKAIEEKFASLLVEGQEAIRRVDPNALACFQPTTMRTRGIDLYTANKPLGVVCAPTGGHGGAVDNRLRPPRNSKENEP